MAIGVLGGAFDPPHNGHVALAEAALDHFALERLVVVPTGTPPHKEVETDAWARFDLAAAAFDGTPNVELNAYELERQGPSYTVDTVRWAAGIWEDVVFLVGADEFADFLSWKDPNGVLHFARLGVATRPGYPRERLDAVLARLEEPERVEFFAIPEVPVSSTDVRERVRRGEPIDDLVPGRVARAIRERNLYR
jgi:nicotinate-nucleotide adenylyltransferase